MDGISYIVVYIFRYDLEQYEHYKWTIKKPATLVKKKGCRYYITIAIIKKDGMRYVDRIISNYGCNCVHMPPNVKCIKGSVFHLNYLNKNILVQEHKINLNLRYTLILTLQTITYLNCYKIHLAYTCSPFLHSPKTSLCVFYSQNLGYIRRHYRKIAYFFYQYLYLVNYM